MNQTLSEEQDVTVGRSIHRILMQSNRNRNWLSRHADTIHNWLKSEIAGIEVSSSLASQTIQAPVPGGDAAALVNTKVTA